MGLYDDMEQVLLSQQPIREKVEELGAQISQDYAGQEPVLVRVLKGAFIFMADLCRAITIPCSMDFMAVSSYGAGTESSGRVDVYKRQTMYWVDVTDYSQLRTKYERTRPVVEMCIRDMPWSLSAMALAIWPWWIIPAPAFCLSLIHI